MATYDSTHTGEQIDEAVELTLGNKSTGSDVLPVYLNANGEAVPVNKDATPTSGSTNIVESGGVYAQLSTKLPFTDVNTSGTITTSNTSVPSCGTVEAYVESVADTKQNNVIAGTGVIKNNDSLSIDYNNDFLTTGKLDNKCNHFTPSLEVGYGQDLVEEMYNAKHSTFDLGKFSIEPASSYAVNITDDGLASGFTTTSYVYKDLSIPTGSKIDFSVKSNLKAITGTGTRTLFSLVSGSTCLAEARVEADGQSINWVIASGADAREVTNLAYNYVGDVITRVVYSNGTLDVYAGANFSNLTFVGRISDIYDLAVDKLKIGVTYGNTLPLTDGNIDLKFVELKVNGTEVFNGNKSGIDLVNNANYIKIGNVNITEDEVASGFDASSYLVPTLISVPTRISDFDIYIKFRTASTHDTTKYSIIGQNVYNMRTPQLEASSTINILVSTNVSSWISLGSVTTVEANTEYDVHASLKNGLLSLYVNGDLEGSLTVSGAIYWADMIRIGSDSGGNNIHFFDGSIDLSSFKIYVYNKLVYKTITNIPYTKSKDGKKMVDGNYRDDVERYNYIKGFSPYYVLDTNSVNYDIMGSPTIENGILSNINAYNFVNSGFNPAQLVSNFGIEAKVYATSIRSGGMGVTGQFVSNFKCPQIEVDSTHVDLAISNTGMSWPTIRRTEVVFPTNTWVKLKMTFKDGLYSCYIDDSLIDSYQYDFTSVYWNVPMAIGNDNSGSTYWRGNIDLNSFKVWLNDKLVYQAVTPPNYTLATVRNTAQQLLANTYSEDATQFLRQHGACTADTAITLPKPYIDTNYFVSVPTSAKSTTGFTPTVTGDYIAEGYTSL